MRRQYFLAALMIATVPVIAGDGTQSQDDALPATYCLYNIGRLPGLPPGEAVITTTAINKHNEIVGWTAIAGGIEPLHPFIWDRKHGMRDLGSLPGHASAAAADIDDAGTVVGQSIDPATGQSLSFIWTHRTGMLELDASLGGVGSLTNGINRSGQIVGSSNAGSGAFHAFLRDVKGDVLDLGAFPDGSWSSTASAVNDRGDVVGMRGDGVIVDAFLWDERNGMQLLVEDAFVHDINNLGEVVGDTVGEPKRAFRWTTTEGFQDLGTLSGLETPGATASAINESGIIVGSSQTLTGPPHAFIWSTQSGMRDLNELIDPSSELASQAVLVIAQAINDAGGIAVDGFVPDPVDPYRGFLLEPRHGNAPCR